MKFYLKIWSDFFQIFHHRQYLYVKTILNDAMEQTTIPTFGKIKLNSFRPLCSTQLELEAIEKYKLPPFIDASCRREPDFQNPLPSISALCRQVSFAPIYAKTTLSFV